MLSGRIPSPFFKSLTTLCQRRTLMKPRRLKYVNDVLCDVIDNSKIRTLNDWKHVRKAILEHEWNSGHYTQSNVDAMIVGYCAQKKDCGLGTSYLNFLQKENIKPNLATVGKYLRLLYAINADHVFKTGNKIAKIEEELILRYYQDLRKDYPVLDSFSSENAILALSVTSEWRQCLDLLKDIKITAVPNIASYSAVIAAAFANGEEELAWQFLEEMLGFERIPNSIAFFSYLSMLRKMKSKTLAVNKLEKLFFFFQSYDLRCPHEIAVGIGNLAESYGLVKNFTLVQYKGYCHNCNAKLTNFEPSSEEFEELKSAFLRNVIVGRDVFVKTNPDELERFEDFVANMGTFDVVLDGLNVAYSTGTKQSAVVYSKLLAAVVCHFVQRNKKVLVLGRMHMNRWPKGNWNYVTENSTVFLTQNISQDDPYLLYCALHSGKNTIVVTRDLMRGHKFLLKSPKLKIWFNRWLTQRQWQLLRVEDNRGPVFRIPPPFTITAQKNNGFWHIPYEKSETKNKSEFQETWLCLKC